MTNTHYPGVWRCLHWLIALLVLVLIASGFWMALRSDNNLWDPLTNTLYAWHKTIGFTVLWLMILRLLLRLFAYTPPSSLPFWTHIAAQSVHTSLYILLLAVPLLGWAGVSAYPALNIIAGLHLPTLPGIAADQGQASEFFEIHATLAYLVLALVALHTAAALKHRWINRDDIYERMRLIQKSDRS